VGFAIPDHDLGIREREFQAPADEAERMIRSLVDMRAIGRRFQSD
jgi:hypothetical protein